MNCWNASQTAEDKDTVYNIIQACSSNIAFG